MVDVCSSSMLDFAAKGLDTSTIGDDVSSTWLDVVEETSIMVDVCSSSMLDSAAKGLDISTIGDDVCSTWLDVVEETSKMVDVCSSSMLDFAAKGLDTSTIGDNVFSTWLDVVEETSITLDVCSLSMLDCAAKGLEEISRIRDDVSSIWFDSTEVTIILEDVCCSIIEGLGDSSIKIDDDSLIWVLVIEDVCPSTKLVSTRDRDEEGLTSREVGSSVLLEMTGRSEYWLDNILLIEDTICSFWLDVTSTGSLLVDTKSRGVVSMLFVDVVSLLWLNVVNMSSLEELGDVSMDCTTDVRMLDSISTTVELGTMSRMDSSIMEELSIDDVNVLEMRVMVDVGVIETRVIVDEELTVKHSDWRLRLESKSLQTCTSSSSNAWSELFERTSRICEARKIFFNSSDGNKLRSLATI